MWRVVAGGLAFSRDIPKGRERPHKAGSVKYLLGQIVIGDGEGKRGPSMTVNYTRGVDLVPRVHPAILFTRAYDSAILGKLDSRRCSDSLEECFLIGWVSCWYATRHRGRGDGARCVRRPRQFQIGLGLAMCRG
ncbi:hypothetical protein N7510_008730 [Penicillium lagena]|uniref:uncharacterized protein n=1 Tax=Penicillium lagena TaxID=94218 RepID=UPI002540FDF6|nr:uncharacterized protein N7510_008730 [Penicillium lagena]KAJ5605949.1 hypothetical protein N7510_008730 [Penicillium lagena]